MRIRTKIDVNYNQGVAGTSTGIVEGIIDSASWVNNQETDVFDKIGINYRYVDATNNPIYRDGLTINGTVYIDGLYEAIKASIPEGLTHSKEEQTIFYLSFIQSMAATFDISPTDIEIIE
jgi:hypothetical protein